MGNRVSMSVVVVAFMLGVLTGTEIPIGKRGPDIESSRRWVAGCVKVRPVDDCIATARKVYPGTY